MKQFYRLVFCATSMMTVSAICRGELVTSDTGLVYDLNAETHQAQFKGISGEVYDSLKELSIPSVISNGGKEYQVVSLGANCCEGNPNIQKVELGANVKGIGAYSFRNCTSLTTLVLNEGLEEIGESSFFKCQSLGDFTFPATLESIGNLAFYNVNGLTTVTLPAGIEHIGAGSFGYCRSLKNFSISESNQNYTVEDGVLFDKTKTELVAYPIGDTRISYTLPSTLKIIGPNSMRNGLYLQQVVMNEGLDSIGSSAFTQSRLTQVNLPSTVRAIGHQAFAAVQTITAFSVASGNEYFKAEGGLLLSGDGKKVYYGVGPLSDVVIPEGVEEILGYSFYTFTNIRTIKLASTVKKIGDAAFYSCSNLNSIDLGGALESVGENSLRRCSQLTSITFPSTLRTIGRQAFSESTGLTEIELNEGLETLGELAFARCYGLKKVTLPSTVTTMDYGAFVYCNQLEEAVLKDGLKLIGNGCFNECLLLSNISFPESIETIGDFAFTLTAIEDLNLNEGLLSVGAAAFEFGKFQTLNLPSTLKTMDNFAFAWNDKLKTVTFGESMETIGEYAFAGSENMTSLTLNEGLKTIEKGAFGSCLSINTIEIPSTVETVGAECFAEARALRKLKMLPLIPPTTEGELFTSLFDGYNIVELIVPEASFEAYKTATEWSKFRMITADASGVEELQKDAQNVKAIYDVNGNRVNTTGKGVYIIEMNDGTTKKVIK